MQTICRPLVRLSLPCCFTLLFTPIAACADDEAPSLVAIRAAVTKSLPLLEAGSRGSLEKRKQCFTCHNQGLVIMALTAARCRGFSVDAENLRTQIQFTADFLEKNTARYLQGHGQGGEVDTAGYALWTLDIGGWKSDATTAAVTEYLLQYQQDDDHWHPRSHRPPAEHSSFTTSYLAMRGLKVFGTSEQRPRIDNRFSQVRTWLLRTTAEETEDRAFRLRALEIASGPAAEIKSAVDDLLARQRNDGGWAQLDDLDADVYATSTVLLALQQAGGLSVASPAYRRGLQFLIAKQHDDGSWHVPSRAKPFQAYFESGYSHGKDQFISIAAAGWATIALSLALPVVPEDAMPRSTP
jgi:N-acyl-D-amino-acid deacylase